MEKTIAVLGGEATVSGDEVKTQVTLKNIEAKAFFLLLLQSIGSYNPEYHINNAFASSNTFPLISEGYYIQQHPEKPNIFFFKLNKTLDPIGFSEMAELFDLMV